MNTILLNFDEDCEKFFMDTLEGDYSDISGRAVEYLERIYKDKGIGDIFFNIFCQSSLTPSKVFTDKVGKFHQKKETIKNSLLEVECFLDKTTSLSDILKIFKIIKKH